ncbi:MAG: oxygen-dependent coproporphyrinogen oxidase [Myxococcales bacterium]|nr:oxygen-dependent coproporphyrinogen oxidase [Myxococcales bacterium]
MTTATPLSTPSSDEAAALANLGDPLFQRSAAWFQQLQDDIVSALEAREPTARFVRDDWQRDPPDWTVPGTILAGGGRTRVIEGGEVFERGGVNFSQVWGRFSPEFAAQLPVGSGLGFAACGISLVLHPRNPNVPTVHMNYRRLSRGGAGWFGGGADLTPYYLDEDDATHFHRAHADACDAHQSIADFDEMKARCDTYFHNSHRGEARGIGGIFFDHLTDAPEDTFAFVQEAGRAFLTAWLPILDKQAPRPWTAEQRSWQTIRRGRYVEFNLLHDRGTTFGIKTGGRTESILMSLPPVVRWAYQHEPAPNSPEADLVTALQSPRDWLGRRG